jgi:hypothetical protein
MIDARGSTQSSKEQPTDMRDLALETPQLDRWVQRLTTTALLALAAGLLGTGIAFYLI